MTTKMYTKQITVERLTIISSKPFSDVVQALDAAIGHPDLSFFVNDMAAAKTEAELEMVVNRAAGSSGLMLFMRLDPGEVLRKELGGKAPQILRFLIGNPLTMKQMARHVPDAASYAPVTVLADERPDGVPFTYDKMASFLASYGSAEALQVARDLDSKIEALLTSAAA